MASSESDKSQKPRRSRSKAAARGNGEGETPQPEAGGSPRVLEEYQGPDKDDEPDVQAFLQDILGEIAGIRVQLDAQDRRAQDTQRSLGGMEQWLAGSAARLDGFALRLDTQGAQLLEILGRLPTPAGSSYALGEPVAPSPQGGNDDPWTGRVRVTPDGDLRIDVWGPINDGSQIVVRKNGQELAARLERETGHLIGLVRLAQLPDGVWTAYLQHGGQERVVGTQEIGEAQ